MKITYHHANLWWQSSNNPSSNHKNQKQKGSLQKLHKTAKQNFY